jgi:hemin uptake protein HemP
MSFDPNSRPPRSSSPASARRTVSIRSAELFRNAQEVIIIHREQEYRLRITRADKLILTK